MIPIRWDILGASKFAKEALHQTVASEVQPWPWSELD